MKLKIIALAIMIGFGSAQIAIAFDCPAGTTKHCYKVRGKSGQLQEVCTCASKK